MKRKREWFENERFWRELFPYMFHPARFERTAAEVSDIVRLVKRRCGTVLDLCCGPGRHAVALAQRGFKVTGVDCSPFMLRKARQHARQAKTKVEFHHTFYSGQELRMLLEQAGFASVTLCGHLDGRPYGPDAPRLVAVARKGASNAS
jgi:SAM-dependent methyltransferase